MPRLIRFALATALAALAVVLPVGAEPAARADATECEGLSRAGGGYELFTPDQTYIPPPLRAFPYDCVSRIADRDIQTAYILIYVGSTFDDYVAMVRSFENAGWLNGPAVSYIDGEGVRDTAQVDADGLAAVGADTQWATSRFSNVQTGRNIISMTYTDGVSGGFDNDPILTGPSIYIDVFVNENFASTGFADPSVLSNLRSVFTLNMSATGGAVLCGSAIMLMLVVGWPGSLLSGVIGSRYEQLFGWTQRGLPAKIRAGLRKTQPRWLVWVGFVAAAVVAGFVDPAFGFNLMSLRVLLTGFASFALFNVLGWMVVRSVVNRIQPDAKPVVNFRWGSLVVVLVAVLVARLLEFSPGVIFGLVAGLTYAVTLVASRKAIVVIVGSAFALVLGLVGWVGYSIVAPLSAASFGNPVLVTITEFLSGVTIEGVSSLPLALLPFAALDGGDLLKWKKWVWGLAYAVGLAAFMLVLLSIPDSFGTIKGDFLRWILLFGVYTVVAVGIWIIDGALTRRKEKPKPRVASAR
jgi:hypothetical protein